MVERHPYTVDTGVRFSNEVPNKGSNMKKLLVAFMLLSSTVAYAAKPKQEPPTYVLWELDTDTVIDERNSDTVRPMASITKLMTAFVVMNSGIDLEETVKVTGSVESSSRIRRGQLVTRGRLLELTLVNSDNLAARTLAETSNTDYATFIDRMNFTARHIGMTNTVYSDSTGLLSTNVTSPNDLKLLVQAVSGHDIFKQSAMTAGTTTTVTVKKKTKTVFNSNTNWFAGKLDLLAAKTGTTTAAGRCLTMFFNKNGNKYVLVVLGARHARERQILVTQLLDKIS